MTRTAPIVEVICIFFISTLGSAIAFFSICFPSFDITVLYFGFFTGPLWVIIWGIALIIGGLVVTLILAYVWEIRRGVLIITRHEVAIYTIMVVFGIGVFSMTHFYLFPVEAYIQNLILDVSLFVEIGLLVLLIALLIRRSTPGTFILFD